MFGHGHHVENPSLGAQPAQDQSPKEQVFATPAPWPGERHFSIEEMLAEPIKRNSELGYYTNFVNLLDMAAIALPTAFTEKALPFGITLCGPAFSDRRLLSIANRIQQANPLTIATTEQRVPATSALASSSSDRMELVVCGAHLEGMSLNYQLTDRGAYMIERTATPGTRMIDGYCTRSRWVGALGQGNGCAM